MFLPALMILQSWCFEKRVVVGAVCAALNTFICHCVLREHGECSEMFLIFAPNKRALNTLSVCVFL